MGKSLAADPEGNDGLKLWINHHRRICQPKPETLGPARSRTTSEGHSPYAQAMTTVTLSSKGQLTIPRVLRDALGLAPGARLQASIDRHGRLVLVPSKYQPQDLFRNRPVVGRILSLDDMDRAIATATARENP